jgi:hypothetical protein
MKRIFILIALTSFVFVGSAFAQTTINFGDLTLIVDSNTRTHFKPICDVTKGDLTLSYTVDMTGLTQPNGVGDWTYTPWTEVGIREEGEVDFNPGPWDTYQGGKGGWVVSSHSGNLLPSPGTQSLHDSHGLQASGGRGGLDYDATDPNTIILPFGTWDTYGFWFDRDGVDQDQALMWNMVSGGTYNTNGVYNIVVTYHHISPTLGTMFMTANDIQQGVYTNGWKNAQPEKYPAGLSWKGDMTKMQVFAGIEDSYIPANASGIVALSNITVNGYCSKPYSCQGFDSPMDKGLVMVKKNRVLPIKAQLLDENGNLLTAGIAPPVINVWFTPQAGGDAIDVTNEALATGQAMDGNQFVFSGGKWQFNLQIKNYTALGVYTITMVSGDAEDYLILPTCTASFQVN